MVTDPAVDKRILEVMQAAMMRCVCSWCAKELRAGSPHAPTTHTICEACYRKAFNE